MQTTLPVQKNSLFFCLRKLCEKPLIHKFSLQRQLWKKKTIPLLAPSKTDEENIAKYSQLYLSIYIYINLSADVPKDFPPPMWSENMGKAKAGESGEATSFVEDANGTCTKSLYLALNS